jgi:predicted SAM-dependent methyltransferase
MRFRHKVRELQALARWPLARRRARLSREVKIVLGAADTKLPGWISTGAWTLDVTRAEHFERLLGERKADAFLAEHVWEHLDASCAALANANCFRFLRPAGHFRVAVPDGLHPDPAYIDRVRPGGTGAGADDHKCLYDFRLLSTALRAAGFTVKLLEWWDEHGEFHWQDWSSADGHVERSRRFDARNRNGTLSYTSLIVDAIKPDTAALNVEPPSTALQTAWQSSRP